MNGLTILTYHRVLEHEDPLRPSEMTLEAFEVQMRTLARWFNVLPLDEGWRRACEGSLPPRAVAITFDDGYADNESLALPVLARCGLTATFFIATGYLDGGQMWNDTVIETLRCAPSPLDLRPLGAGLLELDDIDARAAVVEDLIRAWKHLPPAERRAKTAALVEQAGIGVPESLMMSSDQVVNLARSGMALGAHTATHPILVNLEDAEAEREMRDSRRALETLAEHPVDLFAYPNGRLGDDYSARHAEIAREVGFSLAVSTHPGVADAASDPFQLPRCGPWPEPGWRFGLRVLGARF